MFDDEKEIVRLVRQWAVSVDLDRKSIEPMLENAVRQFEKNRKLRPLKPACGHCVKRLVHVCDGKMKYATKKAPKKKRATGRIERQHVSKSEAYYEQAQRDLDEFDAWQRAESEYY